MNVGVVDAMVDERINEGVGEIGDLVDVWVDGCMDT